GYGNKKMAHAIKEQYEQMSFASSVTLPDEPMVNLAEKLTQIVPGDFAKKVWFGMSGSDANDCIFKLIPFSKKRARMLSFMGAYHGQTMGSLSLSGHTAQARFVSGANVVKVPYPNPYRPPFGSAEHVSDQVIDYIENEVF